MVWLGIGLLVIALILITSYICFRLAFRVPRRCPRTAWQEPVEPPKGAAYEPYQATIRQWMDESRQLPYEELSIRSFDGLNLYARYYEYAPGAPIELMFHGYRGRAERDLSGGIRRCFALGHSAVLVDQRGAGRSEGNVITFGICERWDCLRWVDRLIDRFGEDARILLTGISMGAATVLLAAGEPLPKQVIGVLADCGYTDAGEMIRKTTRELGLPPRLMYPFIKLGARLFGHFNVDETSPLQAVAQCKVPVLFIHGETDAFVPCEMSRRNYEACAARKELFTVPDADHGLAYIIRPQEYEEVMRQFFEE